MDGFEIWGMQKKGKISNNNYFSDGNSSDSRTSSANSNNIDNDDSVAQNAEREDKADCMKCIRKPMKVYCSNC